MNRLRQAQRGITISAFVLIIAMIPPQNAFSQEAPTNSPTGASLLQGLLVIAAAIVALLAVGAYQAKLNAVKSEQEKAEQIKRDDAVRMAKVKAEQAGREQAEKKSMETLVQTNSPPDSAKNVVVIWAIIFAIVAGIWFYGQSNQRQQVENTPQLAPASWDVWVNPYHRQDGTYVPGHYRSQPDGDPSNNWTTYPNVNPRTGKQGSRR